MLKPKPNTPEPKITPADQSDWSAIGRRADDIFAQHGLVVTQGGEPTFVPHQTRTAEWNTAALGPEKLTYARRLARVLVDRLMPGAVAVMSVGKMYAGEDLPRWNLTLHRAPDLGPLWKDPALLRLTKSGKKDRPSQDLPKRVAHTLAQRLGLGRYVIPAYEDVADWMRKNSSGTCALPSFSRERNRFILPPKGTQADRRRWAALCRPAGWVLPLTWREDRWRSSLWRFPRKGELVLFPGSGPMGFRLPLDRLPSNQLKCALTVEERDGELRVFLPPLSSLEAFQQLLQELEQTLLAETNGRPVTLEGYPPPPDPRVESCGITADPGVIEVNLPPARDAATLDYWIRTVYESAAAAELRGFKVEPDGRVTSTGGGAHVLLGGPSLEENPFVKRPNLLSSLLRFFQHHPSLSYLFNGQFIGPSSQAPRPDEIVLGCLEELNIALHSLDTMNAPADPVLIDGIFRHLLLDWHGNTHRAEICMDKFCNPYQPNGRNGLMEFRAIEMTPGPDMLVRVNLLLRALAAHLLEHPFRQPLVDWGLSLQDRWLLPWFLVGDLEAVLNLLRQHGFEFPIDCFQAHVDWRCPLIFSDEIAGDHWQLRQALEPWPVVGEIPGPLGTSSRPVDASTDRLQWSVHTAHPKAQLTVNEVHVPFHPQDDGACVAGIRYRRVHNPWGLQPQIPAHAPLRFDFSVSGKVLQSFRYHAQPQDDSTAQANPSNQPAEALRRRFVSAPVPAGGAAKALKQSDSTRLPLTLDLRALP